MNKGTKAVIVVGAVLAIGGVGWYLWKKNKEAAGGSVSGGTASTQTVAVGKPANSEAAQIIAASTDALGQLSDIISKNFGSN